MTISPEDFEFAYARIADAPDLLSLYNETAGEAGISPVVKQPTLESLRWLVGMCTRCGFPLWTLRSRDGSLVAWAMVRPIAWGPEVCARSGDFSLYIANSWQGRGIASLMMLRAYRQVRRHGFDNMSCWIFGSNRKSLMLARAMRLRLWGTLPEAADIGGVRQTVQIWGTSLDDPEWVAFVEAFEARMARRWARNVAADAAEMRPSGAHRA